MGIETKEKICLEIQGMLLAIQTSGSAVLVFLKKKKNPCKTLSNFASKCILVCGIPLVVEKKNPINQLYKSSCNEGL